MILPYDDPAGTGRASGPHPPLRRTDFPTRRRGAGRRPGDGRGRALRPFPLSRSMGSTTCRCFPWARRRCGRALDGLAGRFPRGSGARAAMRRCRICRATLAVAEATVSLQGRGRGPHIAAALSVTQIHAGDRDRLADSWLSGTIRTLDREARVSLETGLRRVRGSPPRAMSPARSRCTTASRFWSTTRRRWISCAARCRKALARALRDDFPPLLAAEDFAYMLDACAGAYVLLGQQDGEHREMVHNPGYDFNDRLIPAGAQGLMPCWRPRRPQTWRRKDHE